MLITMGSECSLFQLIIAITFASVLSHISLLLLLGRRDELFRGMQALTEGFGEPDVCGGLPSDKYDCPTPVVPPRLPYRMYDDSLPAIPSAVPAGDPGFGAPLTRCRPAPQPKPDKTSPCFSHHYYL